MLSNGNNGGMLRNVNLTEKMKSRGNKHGWRWTHQASPVRPGRSGSSSPSVRGVWGSGFGPARQPAASHCELKLRRWRRVWDQHWHRPGSFSGGWEGEGHPAGRKHRAEVTEDTIVPVCPSCPTLRALRTSGTSAQSAGPWALSQAHDLSIKPSHTTSGHLAQ